MKKNKIVCFIMLTVMLMPVLDMPDVWATTQDPVTNLIITRDGGTGGLHDILLSWNTPAAKALNNQDVVEDAEDRNGRYKDFGVQNYEIEYYDITRNSPRQTLTIPPTPPASTAPINGVGANKGSLYSFKVTPYHFHPLWVTTSPTTGYFQYQAIAPATNQIQEALLMTDIEVEAGGNAGSLAVTWDNPMYGNTQVFPKYAIYYAKQPYPNSPESIKVQGKKVIVDSANCTRIAASNLLGKGPRLSFTIEDENIDPGFYDVAVEPCDADGNEIRRSNGRVTINNIDKSITYSTSLYRTTGARVSLVLDWEVTGKDSAMLKWINLRPFGTSVESIAIFSDSRSAAVVEEQLEGYANRYENNLPVTEWPVPLATISNEYAMTYPIPLSNESVFYGIVVTYAEPGQKFKCIRSDVCEVKTPAVQIRPNTPDIHLPVEQPSGSNPVRLYWDAFLRESFDGDTDSAKITDPVNRQREFTYDNNVQYDLYITDDYDLLFSVTTPTYSLHTRRNWPPSGVPELHAREQDVPASRVPAYGYDITNYTAIDGNTNQLEKNKLYYVKLVAKKGALESYPAYATIYIPVEGDISSPPMLRKPPLSIRRDSTGSDMVTPTSIDVRWITEWSEVYDYTRDLSKTPPNDSVDGNDPNSKTPDWQTKAVKDGSLLYYGDEDTKGMESELSDFYKIIDLKDNRQRLNTELGIGNEVPARSLNLKNCYYETKYLPYTDFMRAVDTARGYENYLNVLMNEAAGSNGWRGFTPQEDTDRDGAYLYFTTSGLAPNTTYAILVRAYRIAPDGSRNYGYANFYAASTAPPETPLIIDPETPVVSVVKQLTTDTTATIEWNNTNTIDYEVVFSDVYYTDIENQWTYGQHISFESVSAESTINGNNRRLTIEGLFPGTEYYFWVRAKSQANRFSFWSNPAYTSTMELVPPNPPRSFGLASSNDLKLINQLSNTDYKPREKNSLTMEWMKDPDDPKPDGSGTSTEVADILTHPDLIAQYIARFGGLISNKEYYFRAKTILTVTMGADKRTQRSYAYLVQICLEADFIDSTEIYVPAQPVDPESSPSTIRQAESGWTRTVHFRTSTSDDDYDSDFDPDLVPLPEEDFELIYDGVTGTLTYRFRTNQKDEKGNYDNRVDQRFITKLVSQNIHNYNIDVTKYEDRVILKRVVEVPYTILKTFEERRINFGIRAGDVTLTLPPGSMETSLVKSIPDYGDKARLQIVFTENPVNKPSISAKEDYVSTPQEVSLFVSTQTQYLKMPYAGKPLGVKLKLNNRYDLLDSNIGSYVNNEQTSGWSRVASTYDKESGRMEFETQPGMYAAIEAKAPDTVSFDQSTPYMYGVASKLAISDMTVYNGNAPATSNQIINIMDAIINGKTGFQINKAPDPATVATLQKAGMNISADAPTVSREQAIAAMVALYEKKTGRRIIPTYTLANSPYSGTASAHPTYQQAMLKAAEVDLLNGQNSLRPKDNISLGELLELADAVMSDAGM